MEEWRKEGRKEFGVRWNDCGRGVGGNGGAE